MQKDITSLLMHWSNIFFFALNHISHPKLHVIYDSQKMNQSKKFDMLYSVGKSVGQQKLHNCITKHPEVPFLLH